MALGLGKPDADTLLFAEVDGSPTAPNRLTRRWQDACVRLDLPRVSVPRPASHPRLGTDCRRARRCLISRRLGHANPTVTLNVYGHLFKRDDKAAARRDRGGDANERQTGDLVIRCFGANPVPISGSFQSGGLLSRLMFLRRMGGRVV